VLTLEKTLSTLPLNTTTSSSSTIIGLDVTADTEKDLSSIPSPEKAFTSKSEDTEDTSKKGITSSSLLYILVLFVETYFFI
jgi:hypothetical protein